MAAADGIRVGIDVGGTFTDFVLFDPAGDGLVFHKEASTPQDPSAAVASGLAALTAKAGIPAARLGLVMHGTTIGLNAIIQRRGADLALVVTEGFRDVLEIARSRMPSSFDLHAQKEVPLIPRARIVEIAARLGPDGTPSLVPDKAEIARATAALAALAPEAVALVLVNGYANPAAEAALARRLEAGLPGVAVSSASEIWPEIREYERTLVACLNAYIQPLMRRYLARLTERLAALGVTAPLYVTASNGGSLGVASAAARPVETILSGPASGVTASARLAAQAGITRIITFDMGGTSSDIAVSESGEPEFATRTDIGGLPLMLPVVDVAAIGAGGGSVVAIDAYGVLKVGPTSVGADPGPVAYGRGGTVPSVTDCYLAAGIVDPDGFLGGRMRLDRAAAEAALAPLGARLGFAGADGAAQAAEAALRVATANMATELYKSLARRGLDPRSFTLVPFGGAGPTHANLLAEEAGIGRIVVPPAAGTFCALGAAASDLRRDLVRSLRRPLDADLVPLLARTFTALEAEARALLDADGAVVRDVTVSRAADLRYAGQAYELRVALPGEARLALDTVAEAFHREHERVYGFRDTAAPIEFGTARLAVVGAVAPIRLPGLPARPGPARPSGSRPVWLGSGWREADRYSRAALSAGQGFSGPAIVEQEDTTVLVLPGWEARVDAFGNLHLTREDAR